MKKKLLVFVIIGTVGLLTGCSTTPKEIVELSSHIGEDIQGLQTSYDLLISQYFDNMREQRLDYLNNEWVPRFLNHWVEDGELIRTAKGEIYWSEDQGNYVPNVGNDKTIIFQSVKEWTEEAIIEIEKKRKELIEPLDTSESELKREIDSSFDILMRSNAAVTAHLNSIRAVNKSQDELLNAFGIEDIRNKVNESIKDASEKAEEGLLLIKKADGLVDDAAEVIGGKE